MEASSGRGGGEGGTRRRRGNQRVARGGQQHAAAHPKPYGAAASYVPPPGSSREAPASGSGRGRGRGGRGAGRGGGGEGGSVADKVVTTGRATDVAAWEGKVVRIISGGETGADRAGLEAGRRLGVATGGTAPKNFLTEQGPDPTLQEYGLVDGKLGFSATTRKNVDDSDGTIAFRLRPGNGTDKTIGWAQSREWGYGIARGKSKDDGWRPVLVICDVSDERLEHNSKEIREWIVQHKVAVINIAGHRETTSGMGPMYGAQVTKILCHALADLV